MIHRPWTPRWVALAAVTAACLAFNSTAKADGDQWQRWSGSDSSASSSQSSDNRNDSQPLVYDIAPAMAGAAVAQAQYDRASRDMTAVQIRTRARFEHSDAYRAAQKELRDAQDAYDAACQPVIDELMKDPAYHKLIEKKTETENALASAPADKADADAIAALKMEYSAAANRMEADALAGDSQVRDAKVRLAAAYQTLTSMIERFEDSLPNQPAVAAAWNSYENSMINRAGANAYLEGALVTRLDVIDANYLRYTQSPSQYCDAWPYPYYGYRYGINPYLWGYYGVVIRRF